MDTASLYPVRLTDEERLPGEDDPSAEWDPMRREAQVRWTEPPEEIAQ